MNFSLIGHSLTFSKERHRSDVLSDLWSDQRRPPQLPGVNILRTFLWSYFLVVMWKFDSFSIASAHLSSSSSLPLPFLLSFFLSFLDALSQAHVCASKVRAPGMEGRRHIQIQNRRIRPFAVGVQCVSVSCVTVWVWVSRIRAFVLVLSWKCGVYPICSIKLLSIKLYSKLGILSKIGYISDSFFGVFRSEKARDQTRGLQEWVSAFVCMWTRNGLFSLHLEEVLTPPPPPSPCSVGGPLHPPIFPSVAPLPLRPRMLFDVFVVFLFWYGHPGCPYILQRAFSFHLSFCLDPFLFFALTRGRSPFFSSVPPMSWRLHRSDHSWVLCSVLSHCGWFTHILISYIESTSHFPPSRKRTVSFTNEVCQRFQDERRSFSPSVLLSSLSNQPSYSPTGKNNSYQISSLFQPTPFISFQNSLSPAAWGSAFVFAFYAAWLLLSLFTLFNEKVANAQYSFGVVLLFHLIRFVCLRALVAINKTLPPRRETMYLAEFTQIFFYLFFRNIFLYANSWVNVILASLSSLLVMLLAYPVAMTQSFYFAYYQKLKVNGDETHIVSSLSLCTFLSFSTSILIFFRCVAILSHTFPPLTFSLSLSH